MSSHPAIRHARSVVLSLLFLSATAASQAANPVPSWNEGIAKGSILAFVERVTREGGVDFVPVEERVAVFDNDGTLWSEQPLYFQLTFAVDRVRALAPQHPEWASQQPFQAVLEGDHETLASSGMEGLMQLILETHAGMSGDEFGAIVKQWVKNARHPRFERPYTELVYQPMLELLEYLRSNGFKVYIVSGGGLAFMRAFAEEVYGVPPEQVVGSTIATRFELREGVPVIVRLPKIDFIDDKEVKPVAIHKFIGRRPLAAFGNSDGDLQMLQYTAGREEPSFGLIVHHTDAEREWAYDRDSHIGRLDKALKEGRSRGWTIVDMKKDWKTIYSGVSK
jgi:phosphoserine phosphatase